jgi:hypothetical protein
VHPEPEAYVLRGQLHRYRLGTELGRRVFFAEDEMGGRWAVKIAGKDELHTRRRLGDRLPAGTLPKVRELVELAGGRLAFLVAEFVPGVRLRDLLLEERRLDGDDVRALGRALVDYLRAMAALDWRVRALDPADVVYDGSAGTWRVVATGELARSIPPGADVSWVGTLLWQAAGGSEVADPPLGPADQRLVATMVDARFGRIGLDELRRRMDRRRLWGGLGR